MRALARLGDSLKRSGKLSDRPTISATGANEFGRGFSETNLDDHWVGGDHDHSGEYPGYTKEQYAQEALQLAQSATNDIIKGYKNELGQVARFDTTNGNYVKGHPDWGIATMFKPKKGIEYYDELEKLETKI